MSSENNFVESVELSTFDSSTLTGTFQPINGSGLSDDVKILRIINDSDKTITISYDGVNDSDVILTKSSETFEFQTNAQEVPEGAGIKYARKGQVIYAKGPAGSGNIYVGGYR
jgi:hypothetical protein